MPVLLAPRDGCTTILSACTDHQGAEQSTFRGATEIAQPRHSRQTRLNGRWGAEGRKASCAQHMERGSISDQPPADSSIAGPRRTPERPCHCEIRCAPINFLPQPRKAVSLRRHALGTHTGPFEMPGFFLLEAHFLSATRRLLILNGWSKIAISHRAGLTAFPSIRDVCDLVGFN